MSEHANTPGQRSKPGKRLEHGPDKAKAPLAAQDAKAKKDRRIMVIMIVAAVVMVLAAAVVVLYNRWFKKPSLPPGAEATPSLAPGESEPMPDIDAVQPKVGGNRKSADIYTILVFGSDVASGSTDTMMLVTYDVTNQKAAVMSLPRDTLVNVRSQYNKQLNAVYNAYRDSVEGIEALKAEVSELVGFAPDYYVKIDWELVGEMVDAIGGVTYDIPYNMDYDDDIQGLHIHYFAGTQKLNGLQAMEIVRWRHNNWNSPFKGEGDGSDLTRLGVQHSFLKAVLKQTLRIKNLPKIAQLADLFGKRVESDLDVENLFWFGKSAILGGLNVDDVEFFTMPFVGVYQGRFRNRVYPDERALLELINEKLNPFEEQVTLRQLDLIRVSADGNTLSSTTGVLADPSAGRYSPPAAQSSQEPSPSVPSQSEPPEDQPQESGAPQESDPVPTPPAATEPVPAETQAPPLEPLPVAPEPPLDPGGQPPAPEAGDGGAAEFSNTQNGF